MKKVNLIAMAIILSAGILAAEGTPATLHDNDIRRSATLSQEFGEGRKTGPSLVALALPIAKSHTVDHQPTYCLPSCDKTTQKALAYWNKKQQEVKDLRAKATQLRTEAVEWNKKVNWKRLAMANNLYIGSIIGGALGTLLMTLLTIATSISAWVVIAPFAVGFVGMQASRIVLNREQAKANEFWLRKDKIRQLEQRATKLKAELEG